MPDHVSPDDIRAQFSAAISALYRAEVPLYGELIEIVDTVNARTSTREEDRIGGERHGAIRLGTASELAMMRRAFAVMGMHPVGYYDLAPAGVPVHSTAFRPIEPDALRRSPFRMFTSLLRLELIADEAVRHAVATILARRRIVSDRLVQHIERSEQEGGLTIDEANSFVAELIETFRWHRHALVDGETYKRLLHAHPLIADIAAFRGPHINHLTPRALDIDTVQAAMVERGMAAKAVIEGPPRRAVPILLRQTSFAALEEEVVFADHVGTHTARFGEVEQRGAALTPKGRRLYDDILAGRGTFADFPDRLDELRRDGLAYFRGTDPILYEDFLPVSAAGIFQSNLGDARREAFAAPSAQAEFEQALGRPVLDIFSLYEGSLELASPASRPGRSEECP